MYEYQKKISFFFIIRRFSILIIIILYYTTTSFHVRVIFDYTYIVYVHFISVIFI